MRLNTLSPELGSKTSKKRLGRGIGSGLGKTSGKGHKGQYARAGGYHKVGFEGGQMPMQRRLPKFGFTCLKSLQREEVRLDQVQRLDADVINLAVLKEQGVVRNSTLFVKLIGSGELSRKVIVHCRNVGVTKGAKASIEKAGGKVEV